MVATRIVAAWYFLKQDVGYPETNFGTFDSLDSTHNLHVNMQGTHSALRREIVIKEIVFLKIYATVDATAQHSSDWKRRRTR